MTKDLPKILSLEQFGKAEPERDFYINTLQDHLVSSHLHIHKPHKHDFYATMIFTQGEGFHDIDFIRYEVQPGSLFTLAPGQLHSWNLSATAQGFIFFHSREFFETHFTENSLRDYPFFNPLQNSNSIIVQAGNRPQIVSLFMKLMEENRSDHASKNLYLATIIAQLYIDLLRIKNIRYDNRASGHDRYLHQFARFEKLLEENFLTQKNASQYAENLHISAKHLNRICRLAVNKTTSELIMERVILEAKREMLHSPSDFNQIAYQLGFEDYAYFSRLFKNKTGLTPSQFVKNTTS